MEQLEFSSLEALAGCHELFQGEGVGSIAKFTGHDQLIIDRQLWQFSIGQLPQYSFSPPGGTAAAGLQRRWLEYAHAVLMKQPV
jgi:hypothetical protein